MLSFLQLEYLELVIGINGIIHEFLCNEFPFLAK
jgi:hypothetical protein